VTAAEALADAGVSEREAEVLSLLGDHLTNAEISARLFISVRTVESHVSALLRKLAVPDRRALADLATKPATAAAPPPEPGPGPSASPSPTPRPRVLSLPAPLTSFVGRAAEREALSEAVQQHRLVTAVGPGGVGKTRLALAVAADVADRFAHGVWYVDLVPVTDPAMIAPAVAAALGAGEQSTRSIDETVLAHLASARALVVLDNAEHLVDGVVVFVERLLRACPQVAVLATSRARLLVPFEQTFPVGGLVVAGDSNAADGPDADADADDAVALFVQRAGAAGGTPLGPGDRRRVAAICRALEGMALAIELAAARLPALGLDGLEAGLADHLGLLAGGQRLDDRHRSLRATLDWSCTLLDDGDQAVLRRVALFASPFTADAAAAVMNGNGNRSGNGRGHGSGDADVAGALGRLADQSLLVVVPGAAGTRYRMLESIRQYASSRLEIAKEEPEARLAHLAWCQAVGAALRDDPDSDRGPWRAGFDAVADDLRAALGWVADQATRRPLAHDLAHMLGDLTFLRGTLGEAERRYVQAARLADDDLQVAATLRLAAGAAMSRHRGNETMDFYRQAADVAEQAGDTGAAARDLAEVVIMVGRAPGMIAELPGQADTDAVLARAWRLAILAPDPATDAALITAEAFRGDDADPLSFELAVRGVELGRRAGDAIAESAALDQLTANHLATGAVFLAKACALRRLDVLAPVPLSAALSGELTDAFQMATETTLAAGDLPAALELAAHVHAMPVYREEPHLGTARLLVVEALVGNFDRVIELSDRFREGWERAGRQIAGNLAQGAAAVSMVHGLRGDDAQRSEWFDIVVALRASYDGHLLATSRIVFNPAFSAIVALHRGEPDEAMSAFDREPEQLREWYTGMWMHWYAALWAEGSVLSGHPQATDRVARARFITAGNPVVTALLDRAQALAEDGPPERLVEIAGALEAAGCRYQSARTLALAPGDVGERGRAALAALGAAPMG
jgi:predicted ATPase/DNA-binding CsgD family transcriptional regulator